MPNCTFCEAGQYQNSAGQSFCKSVRTFRYIRKINSTYAADTSCPNASIAQDAFDCSNGALNFEQNFWHDGLSSPLPAADSTVWEQQSIVDESTEFYACGCDNSCCIVRESGNISCIGGSKGLLCSGCDDDYFKDASTGSCLKCGDWASVQTPNVMALALLVAIVFGLLLWKRRRGFKQPDSPQQIAATDLQPSKYKLAALKFLKTYQQHLKTKIKLFVGYFQIASLLHSSYNVPYPYTYLSFIGKVQFLSADVTKAAPGPCIFGAGYTFASKVYVVGSIAFVVYALSAAVLKYSQHEKLWAQKALPVFTTALFVLYPSFSATFFDVLKCRTIDGVEYVIADLSIMCSGPNYSGLHAFAIFWVLVWACGLPLISFLLLRPVRSELRQLQNGDTLHGFQQHLKDFYAPYRPACWYFEVVEYAKKLLLIGIVPAFSGDVVGAVIAMLLVNLHLVLLLQVKPYQYEMDNFLAACLSALLAVVILISVLLKMDTASLLGQMNDGFDMETAAVLLVTCNVLVMAISVAAYWISVRHSGSIRGVENPAAVDESVGWKIWRPSDQGWDSEMAFEMQEPSTPFRSMADDTADNE
jgi:hypothetical protein